MTGDDDAGKRALAAAELTLADLKVALRVALGLDLSRGECERLVALADRDGDGNIDFEEFTALCRGRL